MTWTNSLNNEALGCRIVFTLHSLFLLLYSYKLYTGHIQSYRFYGTMHLLSYHNIQFIFGGHHVVIKLLFFYVIWKMQLFNTSKYLSQNVKPYILSKPMLYLSPEQKKILCSYAHNLAGNLSLDSFRMAIPCHKFVVFVLNMNFFERFLSICQNSL